jgi:hypothetical protein
MGMIAENMKLLLAHGANPNDHDINKFTVLAYACGLNDRNKIKLLLECGANPACEDAYGKYPVEYISPYRDDLKALFEPYGFISFIETGDCTGMRYHFYNNAEWAKNNNNSYDQYSLYRLFKAIKLYTVRTEEIDRLSFYKNDGAVTLFRYPTYAMLIKMFGKEAFDHVFKKFNVRYPEWQNPIG